MYETLWHLYVCDYEPGKMRTTCRAGTGIMETPPPLFRCVFSHWNFYFHCMSPMKKCSENMDKTVEKNQRVACYLILPLLSRASYSPEKKLGLMFAIGRKSNNADNCLDPTSLWEETWSNQITNCHVGKYHRMQILAREDMAGSHWQQRLHAQAMTANQYIKHCHSGRSTLQALSQWLCCCVTSLDTLQVQLHVEKWWQWWSGENWAKLASTALPQ